MTHRYTDRIPVLPKIMECTGCQQSCKWRDEGGGRGRMTRTALEHTAVLHRLMSVQWVAGMAGDLEKAVMVW